MVKGRRGASITGNRYGPRQRPGRVITGGGLRGGTGPWGSPKGGKRERDDQSCESQDETDRDYANRDLLRSP